jgi:DNA (cytosine-5)-methyltransferase 1
MGVVDPFLVKMRGTNDAASLDKPAPTVTATGTHLGLAEPFLVKYYGAGTGAESVNDTLATVTCKERFGLVLPVVILNGEKYLLDIRFRMLQTHELAAAQGFRKDYKFTGTKTEQVKQIGNAVPRRLARALVAAALSQKSDVRQYMKEAA